MNFAELKEQIAALSPKKRFQLAAFLAGMEEQDASDFHTTLNRRMKAMDAGEKISQAEVKKQHKKLLAKGR
jgi:hypothetical protein